MRVYSPTRMMLEMKTRWEWIVGIEGCVYTRLREGGQWIKGSEEEDPCHLAGKGSATHRVPSRQARHIGSVGREIRRKCASNTSATNKAFGGPVAHLTGRFE